MDITKVEGIGDIYGPKLKEIVIATTEDLLEKATNPKCRGKIADKTDISKALILEWVNRVDLFLIKGIGEECSDLFEFSGVDTVVELAKRIPKNLYKKICEINEEKKLVRRLPSQNEVSDWIKQAKKSHRKVSY